MNSMARYIEERYPVAWSKATARAEQFQRDHNGEWPDAREWHRMWNEELDKVQAPKPYNPYHPLLRFLGRALKSSIQCAYQGMKARLRNKA